MSHIVIIEPHNMLQHAFVVALFPEHHVQVMENIPDGQSAAAADIVIIDAGALRARGLLTGHKLNELQGWGRPIIWIDNEAAGGAGVPRLVRLSPPVKKEELRTAVAACLQPSSAPQPSASLAERASVETEVAMEAKTAEPKHAADGGDGEKEFIELVDVFDETSHADVGNVAARNKG